ncbi:MAG TPA: hypothetical protein VGU46_12895 [Acidobacteriaceae bacterium]|nr:hypothetical protein [Acidobacteriaceae bacterium]
MRILVVEDEIRLAENIATGLREGPGYAVDVAGNGEGAVHLCETAAHVLGLLSQGNSDDAGADKYADR